MNQLRVQSIIERILAMRIRKRNGLIIKAKPLLILTLIDEFETIAKGMNKIYFSSVLVDYYKQTCHKLTSEKLTNICYPFWHMKSESFWQIRLRQGYPELLPTKSVSSKWIRDNVDYVELDPILFDALIDMEERKEIRSAILNYYFNY